MLGGVTRHMLPHLPGVPHLHVNRPQVRKKKKENFCLVFTSAVKVTLHAVHHTIRNDNFKHNTSLQRWNNVATIQNNVATVL